MRKLRKRINHLLDDAKKIPDKRQDGGDENEKFRMVNTIINRLRAFIRAEYGDGSVFLQKLEKINFRPIGIIYNTGHYKNDEAWAKR